MFVGSFGVDLEYLLYDSFVREVISNTSVLQPHIVSVILVLSSIKV